MSRSRPPGPEPRIRRLRGLAPVALAFAFALLIPGSAGAQMPSHRLDAVFPAGGQSGDSVEIRLVGAELESAAGLWFDHPGITSDRAEGEGPPRFRVTIAPEVPIGLHDVRAVGPLGVSNPRAFVVGRRPEAIEQEPNNGPEEAGPIELNRVVNGQIDGATDVDWFAFEGKADQRVLIALASSRIDSRLDGEIRLYDADGRELGFGEGTVGRDPSIDAVLAVDGTYRIEVRDVVYAGSPAHVYRLTVHDGPHVDAVVPRAVEAGGTADLVLLGRNLGGEPSGTVLANGLPLERLAVSIDVPDDLAIDPDRPGVGPSSSPGGGIPGFWYTFEGENGAADPVFLAEALGPVVVEQGPPDDDSPMILAPPCDVSADFREVGDVDVYRFEADKGRVWIIEVIADRIGSPIDANIRVQRLMDDGSLRDVADADDRADAGAASRYGDGTVDPILRFEAPEDGTYQITVGDLFNARSVDPTAVYRLAIRPERPDFRLFLTPNDPANPQGVTLRAGGRSLAYAVAHRLDGDARPIRVEAEGLPVGVSADPVVIGAGQSQAPIVFSASGGAPPKLGTIRLVGRPLGEDGEPIDEAPRVAMAGTITRPAPGNNAPTPARVTRGMVAAVRPSAPLRLSASPIEVGSWYKLVATLDRRGGAEAEFQVTFHSPGRYEGVRTNLKFEKDQDTLEINLPNIIDQVEPGPQTIFYAVSGTMTIPDPRNPEATMDANLNEPSNTVIITIPPKDE